MTAGDVVNGLGAVAGALSFQPAAGVECMISMCGNNNNNTFNINLTDGVLTSRISNQFFAVQSTVNIKLFINNTNYLNLTAFAGNSNCYSGIQIK